MITKEDFKYASNRNNLENVLRYSTLEGPGNTTTQVCSTVCFAWTIKNLVKSKPPLHPQVQLCLSFSFALLSFIEALKLQSTREVKTNFFPSLKSTPSLCFSASPREENPPSWHCPVLPALLSLHAAVWRDAHCHQGGPREPKAFALLQHPQGPMATPSIHLQKFTPPPVILPPRAPKLFHSLSWVQWGDSCFLQPLSLFSPHDFCAELHPHHIPSASPASEGQAAQ